MIGEGTGGVTESLRRRIVMPFAASLGETDHVLGHELVHAFQYDILGSNLAMPLWFIEGMAEYASPGATDAQTAVWLRDAAEAERLPTLDKLDGPRYFPYRIERSCSDLSVEREVSNPRAAWTRHADPSFFGSGGPPSARSAGVGVRVHAFGYLVLELDAVRAFDRPRNGWQFVFGVAPGFRGRYAARRLWNNRFKRRSRFEKLNC
jgi:hypothetical protein